MDNILLGIILFPLSMRFGLICRTWAFLITHNRPLGKADWAFILHLGLASKRPECFNGHAQRIGPSSWAGIKRPECFNGHASPLGFSKWACEPIFQTLSVNIDILVHIIICLFVFFFFFFLHEHLSQLRIYHHLANSIISLIYVICF